MKASSFLSPAPSKTAGDSDNDNDEACRDDRDALHRFIVRSQQIPGRQAFARRLFQCERAALQVHQIGRVSVREPGSHQLRRRGNTHRVICHPITCFEEAPVDEGELVPVPGAECIAGICQSLIDAMLRNIEEARNLLRCFMFDQQVKTRALLVGQAVPAFPVIDWLRPRINHPDTVVKKRAVAST